MVRFLDQIRKEQINKLKAQNLSPLQIYSQLKTVNPDYLTTSRAVNINYKLNLSLHYYLLKICFLS